jgi:flagellar assembly factor FliW
MELDERIYKEKVISFKKGLPGLENLHEYVLLTPDDLYPIYILQSVKEPGILLPVINPFDIDEKYIQHGSNNEYASWRNRPDKKDIYE